MQGVRDNSLLALNAAIGSTAVTAALWVALAGSLGRIDGAAGRLGAAIGALALASVVGGFGSFIVIHLLTAVEHRGIRFFGARRGWRITPDVATSICAHASIGWAIAGFALLLLTLIGLALSWGAGPGTPFAIRPILRAAPQGLALIGFSFGLLVFETLVYIGMRACRFANR